MTENYTTLLEYLAALKTICVHKGQPEVCRTVADEVARDFAPCARVTVKNKSDALPAGALIVKIDQKKSPGGCFHVKKDGSAELFATHARYLYFFFHSLLRLNLDEPVSRFRRKRVHSPAFQTERPVWDLYFAQAARSVRKMDPEEYVRRMAEYGFTHVEVNSLASPEGAEQGVEDEVYTRFYTYCPAMDQFVDSFLIRGYYPKKYLRENLKKLKRNCRLARKYGLTASVTCFEPRNVPDALLAKYPELRGPRIDHPFRSFKPRYSLTLAHPVVKRHYRELLRNLLREAPEIEHLSVWTNDSGAGFEYTHSLYVGSNGGPYMVREWSEKDVFARAAGENVGDFLRLLRDAGAEMNPDFRVALRIEPFGVEREHVFKAFRKGVDLEGASTRDVGWETRYRHPLYEDSNIGPFTIFNNRFDSDESPAIRSLERKGARAHVIHALGPVNNFEPLLGIPAPRMAYEKLLALRERGAKNLSHFGGMAPPASVPWDLNREIFRRFQLDPEMDFHDALFDIACSWAGPENADALAGAWTLADTAVRGFMPNPLYFLWGVWYRILVRPLVPDLSAIPECERAYYENPMLSTHHNPNRVDLRRDVLFDLMTPEVARRTVQRIDRSSLGHIESALGLLEKKIEKRLSAVLVDQRDRLLALLSWCRTRRSVASWIADVYGYTEARDKRTRAACRKRLDRMVASEIDNARDLLRLWKKSKTDFMAYSEGPETSFIYNKNFGRHLERKIRLMEKYGHVEPNIDHDIIWRVRNLDTEK